ncbi:MAG: hypothetical protein HOO67_01970, partial [Candidatus Peribacteraceae bacterium]|nr:hypothetical protein [Candidatus Peribacteraceae bacterium]
YGVVTLWPPVGTNPDPNHAHADFAVWINGTLLDFSGEQYMSAPPAEDASTSFILIPSASAHGDVDDGHVVPGREYLHLHDGNGQVIHRHKLGLTFGDFFASLTETGVSDIRLETRTENNHTYTQFWFCTLPTQKKTLEWYCDATTVRLFVNGIETPQGANYVFTDGDQLLITDATDPAEVKKELSLMTNDACLYSKTCPWRGEPPAEGCIADPEVPCTE